ncbi:MAG: M23 family metallopeptidase [Cyclobacteriaceae bacterium]|nr:M23 family metallopeptidase [Cyclobacteriaceae bacterium]
MRLSKALLFVLFFLNVLAVAQENPYLFPIRPGQQNYLAGTMGEMRGSHFHAGMDIKTGGASGLAVLAAADGYVSRIKVDGGGYGNALYIAHPQYGTTTVYGHLLKFEGAIAEYVLKNQYQKKSFSVDLNPEQHMFRVKKGDVVAISGNSGSSSGPHLHFEIRNAQQVPINPLKLGFNEIKDDISPTVQKIALKTMNNSSRVEHQFGYFEFTPSRLKNEYSIAKTIEVYGEIGISLMGYDQLNGVPNRNGIPNLSLSLDEREVIQIVIDKVPFDITRQVLCYRDYGVQTQGSSNFQKLYIDDGNELDFYTTDGKKGILSIRDTLLHHVDIVLSDVHGNESTVKFKLKGSRPRVTAIKNDVNFKPIRQQVNNNTLVFMGKKAEHNGYFAHVYANRMTYELSSSYYVNDYSVYLWDLRIGLPDSIELCGEMIYPKLEMTVPSGADFKYYKKEFDLHFYKNSLFDTLFLKTDYMDELANDREFFEISDAVYPLKKNIRISFKPQLSYAARDKVAAYFTSDLKNFSYEGGRWSGERFELYTNQLGKFTLLTDTIPPVFKIVSQNSDSFSGYISDKHSGIKSYELWIDGEWILMNHDPKNNFVWAEKLDKSKPFKGKVRLKVLDNVNNEIVYTTQIN